MPKIPRLGDYLTSNDVKEGDILTVTEEPKLRPKEETGFDRDTWGIKVQLPNKTEKLWTLNKTTYNALWDAYGDESTNWVGKKVRISTEKRRVRGEQKTVLYGEPITQPKTQQSLEQPVVVTNEVMQLINKETLAKLPREQQNRILRKLATQLNPTATDTT